MLKNENAKFETPDFNKFAGSYDRFLTLIAPVGEAIIEKLPANLDTFHILDVACGTGEPGLTLASRHPSATIESIDAAQNMIAIATQKAKDRQMLNISFQTMSAEQTTFAPNTFDYIISRFGLGMFGDTQRSAVEAHRILKPGGKMVVSVWHDMSLNTLFRTMAEMRQQILDKPKQPIVASPGAQAEEHFAAAGLSIVSANTFSWHYHFATLSDLEAMVCTSLTNMLRVHPEQLRDETEGDETTAKIIQNFAQYKDDRGAYLIPHTCLLIEAQK